VLAGRNKEGLKEPADAIASLNPSTEVLSLTADLTNESQVEALFSQAVEKFGTVDVVLHAAGSMVGGPVGDLEPSAWFSDYEVNVKGSYTLAHYYLKAVPAGTLIFMGTLGASFTFPGLSAYSGSKMALIKLAEYLDAGKVTLSLEEEHFWLISNRETKPSRLHCSPRYRCCHRDAARHGRRLAHAICAR
jgi:NADP-dependent 3-hydroxy acid dehydrogenase YdfG